MLQNTRSAFLAEGKHARSKWLGRKAIINALCAWRGFGVQVGVGQVVAGDDAGQYPQALDAPPLLPVRQLPLRLLTHAIPSLSWGSERREGVALAGGGDVYSDRNTIIRSVGVSVVIQNGQRQWPRGGFRVLQKASLTIARSDVTIC